MSAQEQSGHPRAIPALKRTSVAYIGGITTTAVAIAILVSFGQPRPGWHEFLVGVALLGFLAAVYRRPLPFGPNTHLMLDTAVLLAAALLLPVNVAMAVALAGPGLANLPRRSPWAQPVFNGGQGALQVAAAAAVLGVFEWNRAEPFADARFLVVVPAAAVALHLVNSIAVAGILALQEGVTFIEGMRCAGHFDRAELTGHFVQWGLALLAVIVVDDHPWGLILLGLPGVIVFEAFDRHVRLRLRAEAQLTYQAFHDPLTGLANRSHLMQRLTEETASPGCDGRVAVLFLDLDGFKQVNDTYGHEIGDWILIEVAKRLRQSTGAADTVARLGGDEFIIVTVARDDGRALRRLAQRVISAIAEAPFQVAGEEVRIGASVGIALASAETTDASALLRNADLALYQAKRSGRGRFAAGESSHDGPARFPGERRSGSSYAEQPAEKTAQAPTNAVPVADALVAR